MSRKGIADINISKKARIKGVRDFNDAIGIPYFHSDVFNYHGVSKEQGWAIIKQDNELFDRRHHNNEDVP
jgi:hypothetical protein